MRTLIAALVLVCFAPSMPAQPNAKLDQVLRDWERVMGDMQTLAVKIDRATIDKSLGVKEAYTGFALFSKGEKTSGMQARLKLTRAGGQDNFEEYLFVGNNLYVFVPSAKVVRVYAVPKNKFNLGQERLVALLFDMGVQEAKARYDMKLEEKNPPDPYHYIHIHPKQAEDKAQFSRARLVLSRSTHFPVQLWFVQPNGVDVTWDFREPSLNAPLQAKLFEAVPPQGWKFVKGQLPQ